MEIKVPCQKDLELKKNVKRTTTETIIKKHEK